MGKTLNLTLKKKWFDMIASGEKKEEYRELKPYWVTRLIDTSLYPEETKEERKLLPENICFDLKKHALDQVLLSYFSKPFDISYIEAFNGAYFSTMLPHIKWKHKGIRIGKPNPAWCEPEDIDKTLFILEIGELLTK